MVDGWLEVEVEEDFGGRWRGGLSLRFILLEGEGGAGGAPGVDCFLRRNMFSLVEDALGGEGWLRWG